MPIDHTHIERKRHIIAQLERNDIMTTTDILKALPNPFIGVNLPPKAPSKPTRKPTRKGGK